MHILVIGDVCVDVFVYGKCSRICPEGPVPVLDVKDEQPYRTRGMAANVAENVHGMGATTFLACSDTAFVQTKTRYVDSVSGQILLRLDEGGKTPLISDGVLSRVLDSLYEFDALIVSDYGKGFLDQDAIRDLGVASIRSGIPSFLDTKYALTKYMCSAYTAVKVNEKEANDSPEYREDNLVITLGARGCSHNNVLVRPEVSAEVRSVSGAGDTFLAALAVKYTETKDMKAAMEYANKCSQEVIRHPGTTPYKGNTKT